MKTRNREVADHIPRVLIVDDERRNRKLLEVMLEPEGFIVSSAASGEEALAMVVEQAPDLILLDVMMPCMDGYQVVAKLKGSLATKSIPIIMVTSLDDRNARLLSLTAGAEDFLTKPVDRAELCVRVRNLLRLKAYGDFHERYSQRLELDVAARTAELVERTRTLEMQAEVLTEQAALLDLTQDAIIVRDMPGRILFWSHGAEVAYGWPSGEAIGKNLSELLRTEYFEPVESIDAALLCDGLWEGEVIHQRRDGMRLAVASRWALQRSATGSPFRILTINSDNTRRTEPKEAARPEADKLAVAPENASIADAIDDALGTVQGTARAKGIGLGSELAPELPAAYADPTRLRQILVMLLDNAIKFTPAGGGVEIRAQLLEQLELEPRVLLVEVSDSGCGIGPEITERLFERLYQVSDNVQAGRNGLGPGLHLCKQLVTRQGGNIWAERRPEGGSTFSFTLPVSSQTISVEARTTAGG